jgi:hypothetical protein
VEFVAGLIKKHGAKFCPKRAAKALCQHALMLNTRDNVSVVLAIRRSRSPIAAEVKKALNYARKALKDAKKALKDATDNKSKRPVGQKRQRDEDSD